MYVMNTKLTLRMQDPLIREAKNQAARRGKSVSQMFGEFIVTLRTSSDERELPPVTNSLLGVMKGRRISEDVYRKYLREKHS